MAVHPWRILSLCAGVGGIDLGVRLAEPSARSVCYVEREAAAASVLVARMEDGWLHPAPVWSDLATFDAGAWRGTVDCVVSGDPCQPNSVAGRRRGNADDRWLADRVVDAFDRSGAYRLFRENVPGNTAGQLGYFVPALERLGCRVAVGIFSAEECGFAHRRERLFIMADRDGLDGHARPHGSGLPPGTATDGEPGRSGVVMADAAGRGCDPRTEEQARRFEQLPRSGRPAFAGDGSGGLADAHDTGLSLGAFREIRRGAVGEEGPSAGEGGDHPLFCPGPADPRWGAILARAPHLEPAVRRMAHRVADRVDRIRACGNGVVPLVAGHAWRTLAARLAADAAVKVA